MKQTILFLIIGIIAAFVGCRKQTFDERVMAEVNNFNEKEAPKRVDMNTTFDSIHYEPSSKHLTYYYTINADLNLSALPQEEMRKVLLQNVRSSIQWKAHKEHGLSFRFVYLLKSTKEKIIDCTFTPEDYK